MAKAIKLHGQGIREMVEFTQVQGKVRDKAEEIATRARTSAPFKSGSYRDSIFTRKVRSREEGLSKLFDRTGYVVGSDAKHAGVVESRHRTLGRAALGGKDASS